MEKKIYLEDINIKNDLKNIYVLSVVLEHTRNIIWIDIRLINIEMKN